MKSFLKKLIKKNDHLYLKLALINKVGFPLYFINFFFQRIIRFQSNLKFNICFTSRVVGSNLIYNKDLTTLASFAVSGNSYIQSMNGIKLGKNFLFAPGLRLISSNHDFEDKSQVAKADPITIGDNCWFGANVIILPGVQIGNNCIVGAGSVVTKNFPENDLIIVGNPAKVIKKLGSKT